MTREPYIADRREAGGWMVMRWDASREIYVEGAVYRTKRLAQEALREFRARSEAAAALGRRGGAAGRGAAKRRDVDYRALGRAGARRKIDASGALAMRQAGATLREIADRYGVTVSGVSYSLRRSRA